MNAMNDDQPLPFEVFAEPSSPENGGDGSFETQLAAERDRVLRLQAEIQNLTMRQSRELRDERKYAALPIIRDVLPVLDNIDRAIDSAVNNSAAKGGESSPLLDGVKLVRQQLVTIMAQHNCVAIAADGATFDPNEHQAILQQPSADVPAGQVMMVTQSGYKLHERVVRPALVIVSAGPADNSNIA